MSHCIKYNKDVIRPLTSNPSPSHSDKSILQTNVLPLSGESDRLIEDSNYGKNVTASILLVRSIVGPICIKKASHSISSEHKIS